MVESNLIVITKDDKEKFEKILEYYCDEIRSCIDFKNFMRIVYYAYELDDYNRLFWFIQNHRLDEKLVFVYEIYDDDNDDGGYRLENYADLLKKYNSFMRKQSKTMKIS